MSRTLIPSGSPFEREIGFSRAVRVGDIIEVSGTAPISEDGGVAAPGDMYAQTKRCFDIALAALKQAGADARHVTRIRMMLTDISLWREAARAQGEIFADIRPASTIMEVSRFIDPAWLVEIELSAHVHDA